MRKRKKALILGIILLVLALGIGYAYLTTTLSINGVTDVDSNTWNVYWNNPQVTTGSVTGEQVTTASTIDTNKTTVSFQVRLSKPGDYYEFTIDAKNDGSIDAMIDTITKTTNIPNYINYTVTYEDDRGIYSKQYLKAASIETIKVRVEYSTDINASDLPSTATSLNLSFGITYIQADSTAQTRTIYHLATGYMDDPVEITEQNPSLINESVFYLGITYGNGDIAEKDISFKATANGPTYTFFGGDGGLNYNRNIKVLRKMCTENNGSLTNPGDKYRCELSDIETFTVILVVSENGNVRLLESSFGECEIKTDGEYSCSGAMA